MKIVFLSRYQNSLARGAENFVFELSKRLSEKHSVDVFSDALADDISKILKGSYQVVIPINGRLQSLKFSLGRISGRYKLLITGHSGIGRDDIWNIAVCKPDVFVSLTDHMAKWARGWAWGSKVVKIHNGVDLKKFNPNGEKIDFNLERPVILSVGALVWYKHHEKAIKAVRNASLVILGKGPEEKKLRKMGQELLGDRFRILNLDSKDMPKAYRAADLFTLPSWERESFGLVYLEAMASGLGVVAPDDETRREIVGKAGILTDDENYADAIKKALAMDWSDKARAQAKEFSWKKVADEYERTISDMIKV